MKSSASESKPFQSRSKGEIPGQARRKERLSRSKLKQAFLIDSDAELFMYLIQCIRFGSWKVRRLNRALGLFADGKTITLPFYILQLVKSQPRSQVLYQVGEIPTLSYTRSLEKVPLSGESSPYRPL